MAAQIIDVHDFSLDLEEAVRQAAAALREGEMVVVPTETVYGVAVKPNTAAGLSRLTDLRRGADGPLTPHLPDAASASAYLGEVSNIGERLMNKLWPGPVGLMFDVPEARRAEVTRELKIEPSLLFNAQGRIVLRCPDDLLTRSVLRGAQQPIVVTRAGLPGGTDSNRPPTAETVPEQVSLVLDAGPTRFSKPSTVVHVTGDSWEIVREGVYDRRIIEKLLRTTIMFVCSGNTCRSAMAAALARKHIAEQLGVAPSEISQKGFEVISAGAVAMPGMPATPQAVEAVEEMGGDLSTHRSQPLSVELINRADLIVTMSRAHKEGVTSLVPSAEAKTITLHPDRDIEDPIGSDTANYRQVADQIDGLLHQRLAETVLPSKEQPR